MKHKLEYLSIPFVSCKEREDERSEWAATLNFHIDFSEKNGRTADYINALKDIKKLMKIPGTVYDLMV